MQNTNRKFGVLFLTVATLSQFVFPGQIFADWTSLNTDPLDYQALQASNSATDPGCSTCWSTSVAGAAPGEQVSFLFYYHNSGEVTAENLRVTIDFWGDSQNLTGSGLISADNASPAFGSAVIHAVPGVENLGLTFAYGKWYPNRDQGPVPVSNSGTDTNVAVNIGNIEPGWNTAGFVVLVFNVTGNATGGGGGGGGTPEGQIYASPNPCTATAGQQLCTTYLTWSTTNAANAEVWVSENGGPEVLNARLPSCSDTQCAASWIQAGHTYEFTLYDNVNGVKNQLSSISVQGISEVRQLTLGYSILKSTYNVGEYPTFVLTGLPASQTVTVAFYSTGPNGRGCSGVGPACVKSINVDASGRGMINGGLFVTEDAGSWNSYYTFEGQQANTIFYAVTSPVVPAATLAINPTTNSVAVGSVAAFTAIYDPDGAGSQTPQNVTAAAAWSSANPAVATSLGTGQFRGVSAGTTQVTAVYAGITATASLTVTGVGCTNPQPTLNITPPSASVSVNNTTGFMAIYDSDGPACSQPTQDVTASAAWTSANPSIASALGNGQFRGVAGGSTQITASYGGLVATATLNVTVIQNPTLTIIPDSATVEANGTMQFVALFDPDGSGSQGAQDVSASAAWSSSNSAIAASLGSGRFRGAAAGGVTVTATYSGATDTAQLTVTAPPCTGASTLAINPANASLNVGQTTSFTAVYDPDGAACPQPAQDVTGSATFTSSNQSVLQQVGSGQFRAIAAGTAIVTVVYQGVAATAVVTVTGVQNPTLTIVPSTQSVPVNQTTNFVALFDPDGTGSQGVQDVTASAVWTSSNSSVAASLGAGRFRGVTGGSVTITATFDGATGTANLTVTGTQNATLTILPQTLTINVNQIGTFVALFDPDGSGAQGTQDVTASAAWTSSNPSVAVALSNGQFRGVTNGTVTVTATYSGTTATATLIISGTGCASGTGTPSLTIIPASNSINANQTISFIALYDSDGASCPQGTQDVTSQAGWSSSNQSIAVQVGAGQFRGLQPGTVTITAFYGGATATASLTITGTGNAPFAQTLAATNITQNSAALNGTVNPNGASTNYYFEYGTTASLGQVTATATLGGGSVAQNILAFVSGLAPNATYFFRIVATNSFGTSQGTILTFSTGTTGGVTVPTVVTLSATVTSQTSATLNGQVNPNGSNAQAWFEYGVSPSLLNFSTNVTNVGSGSSFTNFSQFVSNLQPGTIYYYRAVASNAFGTSQGQVLTFVTSGTGGGTAPTVVTRVAQFVSRNSALLNGDVNPNGGLTTAWFEYGATVSLGLRTVPLPMGSGNGVQPLSAAVTGLLPNTTYYFRAVAQNQFGTSQGAILTFRTLNGTTGGGGGTVIVRPVATTTGTALTCITLVPTLNVSELIPGREFTYTATYRNGCAFDLMNAVLKVVMPVETDFLSTSFPNYTQDGPTLTFTLGRIAQNVEVAVNIRGRVKDFAKEGDNLIFSAILTFNDNRNAFQSIIAYLTGIVNEPGTEVAGVQAEATSTLSATVSDAFKDILGSWIFWLFLILLILFLIFWFLFRRREEEASVRNIRVES